MTQHDARVINGGRPFRPELLRAARPWRATGTPDDRTRGRDCLAAAMWYEAGNDRSGQRSVAQVVLNRARHPAFAASICAVVFQGAGRVTGCQFTFTCDGSMQRRVPSAAGWQAARRGADEAVSGAVDPRVGLATHYHTDWVVPIWSGELEKLAAVGTHLFFQWPGYWGSARVFRGSLTGKEARIDRLAALSPAHAPEGGARPAESSPASAPTETAVRFEEKAQQQGDQFFVLLRVDRAVGEHAVAAVNECATRQRCLVLGWDEQKLVARRLPLTPAQLGGLGLLYRREDGHETIKWNCQVFAMPASDRCLPPPIERAALLR